MVDTLDIPNHTRLTLGVRGFVPIAIKLIIEHKIETRFFFLNFRLYEFLIGKKFV